VIAGGQEAGDVQHTVRNPQSPIRDWSESENGQALVIALPALALGMQPAPVARAATITVTTTNDNLAACRSENGLNQC
jgi:hypothetical protein